VADHYNQADLANLYDDENGWDASADFYRDLALERGARSVLDLGCGTGTVMRGIVAALGGSGVGVDPARPMLEVARRKTTTEAVEWIEGDARTIRLHRKFDFILMTGHAFQAMLTDEDQAALLATIAAHLAPDGRFGFDTRNPAAEEWLEWTPELSSRRVETATFGPVDIHDEAVMQSNGRILDVVEHYHARNDGRRFRADFQLRFTPRAELAARVMEAWLTVENCFGDWKRQPFAEDAQEIVLVGRLAR
jgi:SAM-dependent methyltransferase